jgi:hypothetical protein
VNKEICPRDCESRKATCHIDCERYAAYLAENRRMMKEKIKVYNADEYRMDARQRMQKIKKRRKRA